MKQTFTTQDIKGLVKYLEEKSISFKDYLADVAEENNSEGVRDES